MRADPPLQLRTRLGGRKGGRLVGGCDTLAAIYESMYGKAPMHMTACEEVIGLPGDVLVGGRMASVALLNELHK